MFNNRLSKDQNQIIYKYFRLILFYIFLFHIAVLMYSIMLIFILIPLTPVFLDIVIPLNESRPRFFAIEVEFKVNKDEYFLPIFCYTTFAVMAGTKIVMANDAMHVACTAHACSLFAAVRYIYCRYDDNLNAYKVYIIKYYSNIKKN